jgi:Fanconi anemia group M protein
MKKVIEDIFSAAKKEKDKEEIKTEIILDSREKQSLIAANLREQGVKIKFETLEIADYLVNNIAIERKTFRDFQASIIDRRLAVQLEQLKKYKKKMMIIEGFLYDYSASRISENAIKGAMLSSALSFDIPILFTKDEEDTAKLLKLLAKKQDKQKTENAIRPQKSTETLAEQKQFVLEGFPGIGPTSAKKLIELHKNLKTIFNSDDKILLKENILSRDTLNKMKEILEK